MINVMNFFFIWLGEGPEYAEPIYCFTFPPKTNQDSIKHQICHTGCVQGLAKKLYLHPRNVEVHTTVLKIVELSMCQQSSLQFQRSL